MEVSAREDRTPVPAASTDLVGFSRDQIRKGSKSFSFASFFFSKTEREGAWLLYSWCRACDDRIDQAPSAEAQLQALADLERDTRRAARGDQTLTDPVFQGLAVVLREFQIPEKYPLDLLRGMRMDVEGREYQTLEELEEYCYCVAGVVGLMMCHVMGLSDSRALSNAVAMGSAMQLTNICRDVEDDLALGRIYIPTDFLLEAGLTRANFATSAGRARWPALTARLLDAADERYRHGVAGLRYLSFRAALAVAIAGRVYRRIGVKVRARGERAWENRTYTRLPEKLATALIATADVGRRLFTRLWRPWRPARIDRVWGQT